MIFTLLAGSLAVSCDAACKRSPSPSPAPPSTATPTPAPTPEPTPTPTPTPTPNPTPTPTPTPVPSGWVWGVTLDDPWNTGPATAALGALSRRVTARVVFDEGQSAAGYVEVVRTIHGAADVMGEILDSEYVVTLTVQQYLDRTTQYLDALGDLVDVWEVGNEVNGEWLGSSADVVAKVRGAWQLARARGKRTALTLYYNAGCFEAADHEMFTWASAQLPADLREGLDWVLVSYYEDDCNGLQPDWAAVFKQLAALFPSARLGIGECGTTIVLEKEPMLRSYYGLRLDEPRFIGGFFWWYFSEDMVPATKPLWTTLDGLIKAP